MGRMEFTGHMEYGRPPAEVFAMLIDEDYVRARAESTGGTDVEVSVHETADTVEITNAR